MVTKNQIKFVKSLHQKKYRQSLGLFIVEEPTFVDWVVLDSSEEYLPLCDVMVDLSELHSAFRNMYWNEVESLL